MSTHPARARPVAGRLRFGSIASAPWRDRRPMTQTSDAMRAGAHDILPMLAALVPFALALGVAIDASIVPDLAGLLLAPVLYAGSANYAVLAVLDAGGSAVAAVLAGLVINVRFAMYAIAMAARFRNQPRWFRLLGPWAIVDQTFAVASERAERSASWFRAYWISAAVVIGSGYTAAIAAGMIVGPIIPPNVGLELAIPALFVGMLAGRLRDRPTLAAVVVAGLVTALALELPHGLGLPAGALAGAGAAVLVRRIR